MQIVIDIDDETYNDIKKGKIYSSFRDVPLESVNAIANGNPLPKGHKVIDATLLQEHLALVPMDDRTFRETVEIIDWFPSII